MADETFGDLMIPGQGVGLTTPTGPTSFMELFPGVGDVGDAAELITATINRDGLGALFASSGFIPIIGGATKQVLKGIFEGAGAAKGRGFSLINLGTRGDEITKKSMEATAKQPPDRDFLLGILDEDGDLIGEVSGSLRGNRVDIFSIGGLFPYQAKELTSRGIGAKATRGGFSGGQGKFADLFSGSVTRGAGAVGTRGMLELSQQAGKLFPEATRVTSHTRISGVRGKSKRALEEDIKLLEQSPAPSSEPLIRSMTEQKRRLGDIDIPIRRR